jgi:enolase-phosphatase E1
MSAGLSQSVRGILLDIEGTTTPIAFVHEVLFTYARENAKQFLTANLNADEVRKDVALLRQEHALEVDEPPALVSDSAEAEIESLAAYIEWLIARDRKSTGLKSLQGKIWKQGYENGSLQSQVFADVAPALQRWHESGLNVSIFSSGSVLAQKLLFAHTEAGDLTRFLDNYFDTNVGKKGDPESYRQIAAALQLEPPSILFISDVVAELDAARATGMKTLLSLRPGNVAVDSGVDHQAIHTFDELRQDLQDLQD